MPIRSCILLLLIFCTLICNSQSLPVQTLKGSVAERSLKKPLFGATVELAGTSSRFSTTDSAGNFRFENVPVGRHAIKVSFVGFKMVLLGNVLLESGKELNLTIEMDEDVSAGNELVVLSKLNKAKPINDWAMVSARMFSVEETKRFAAGINDPSRIAVGFAGVSANGDGNSLVIRGNAPNGLLWRMEGVDIPNPNHLARVGTSGGGISILSAQLLANSDFMTAAFPAEYGNALSGVFDVKLRKGNKDKREHTVGVSTIGLDAATEGYFKKGYGGSYLVNYRYAFLTVMQKLGFDLGDAPTSFQDLSFNINLPLKKLGNLSVFGFGGISQQKTVAVADSVTWFTQTKKRKGNLDLSNTGALGVVHTVMLSKNTQLKTIYSLNGTNYREEDSRLDKFNGPLIISRNNQFKEQNNILSVVGTHKFNKHLLLKAGSYITFKKFNLHQSEAVSNVLKDKVRSDGSTVLYNYFTQMKWDPNEKLSLQAGMDGQYLALNNTRIIEPRVGLKYKTGPAQYLSMGFGLHSQMQPLGNYFARIKVGTDTLMPNMALGFSRSAHYVVGYSFSFAPNWNLKTELYYQWLYHIPVTANARTSYSIINLEDDYAIEPLANTGKGKNYGMEITVERWWNDQFYLLGTLSLFRSAYLPSDKAWRSTRYNSNTASTLLAGKEWRLKRKRPTWLSIDVKMLYNGGQRVTPIDLTKSIAQNKTVLDNRRIYDEKLPMFLRMDLQAEWKFQHRKQTSSLIAGVQNLTNRKNATSQTYDGASKKIIYSYLMGIIPVIGYKIDF